MSHTTTYDCYAAQQHLQYSPVVPLDEGMRSTIESFPHLAKGSAYTIYDINNIQSSGWLLRPEARVFVLQFSQSRSFEGEQYLVTDMDFAALDFDACVAYLERFLGEPCEKLYYAERNKPLDIGIRWVEDDVDYALFLDTAYEEPDVPISMYIDHGGDALDDLLNTDSAESGEVTQCEDQRPAAVVDTPSITADVLEQEIGVEPQVQLNKTDDDPFLGKLCVPGGSSDGYEGDEEGEKETGQEPTPIFNPNIGWKMQEPVLGMRTRLLAQCSKGECPFRLWATWMSSEHSFQIKSLKPDHQCARNFKVGSIVTYQWIGGHYTKEILHRQKLTIRQLRLEVIKKFGIDVSLSQCRRARKHALNIIEGTLSEHYAKLWSYGAEIRKSNPGSTVCTDILSMPDGKNYFNKWYVLVMEDRNRQFNKNPKQKSQRRLINKLDSHKENRMNKTAIRVRNEPRAGYIVFILS
ncbi:hypothetical protein LXL04_004130 [Taraxacum kok-saghyz]